TVVEATSGNTGVGLAIACVLKGYQAVFVMPDKMSEEKRRLLRAFGARVIITPTAVEPDDPRSYYSVARRLVELGLRLVQMFHGSIGGAGNWDAHGNLKTNHGQHCREVDQPIGALIRDLKQRGMLDETIVVIGTEFGRTPGTQNTDGRDHHPFAFSVVMAGGGLKGGVAHGATDALGFHAIENRHYVTDIHATVLDLMGIDPKRLEVPGRKRLAIDFGQPIREIIA
ncbi:MAG: pyridoxal-phosphate dependent enzyme, partial [Pirellulales bacterium]